MNAAISKYNNHFRCGDILKIHSLNGNIATVISPTQRMFRIPIDDNNFVFMFSASEEDVKAISDKYIKVQENC